MTQPITPKQALKSKSTAIPPIVFEVFNALISDRAKLGGFSLGQKVVEKALKDAGVDLGEALDKGWLDIEPHYRKAGWDVDYDKPAYCEAYEASWSFKPAKGARR